MANTLKFGNGEWYGKKDTILAYNDENRNFKPLPFDFSRESSATVINKDGLIETVGSGQPRIDYKDDSKGALLLEPSRSNLITYSEDFSQSYWNKSGGVIISSNSTTSIDGTLNATKITGANAYGSIFIPSTTVLSGVKYTYSVFAKKNISSKVSLRAMTTGNDTRVVFNLDDLSTNISEGYDTGYDSSSIEVYSNGWYKCILTVTTATTSLRLNIYPDSPNNVSSQSGVYIYGAQLEQGSYATSYIPTSGSTVTRLRDECLKDDFSILTVGNSYTLFFDVDLNEKDDNKTFFNIENSSGTTSFTVRSVLGGVIRVYNNLDSQYPTNNLGSSTNKWVVRIDGTSFKIFGAEGSLSGTLTTARDMGEGIFGRYSQTKINDFKVYNTALSDSESEALVN